MYGKNTNKLYTSYQWIITPDRTWQLKEFEQYKTLQIFEFSISQNFDKRFVKFTNDCTTVRQLHG